MKLEYLKLTSQPSDFFSGTQAVVFSVVDGKDVCCGGLQGELVKFFCLSLPRQDKGIVVRYIMKVSGYFR